MLKTPLLFLLTALFIAWAGIGVSISAETSFELNSHATADTLNPVEDSDSLYTGRSVQGREISVFRYGSRGLEKIIIVGGIHGNEPESVIFAKALVACLDTLKTETLAKNLIVVPLLNPDGYELKSRKNASGIDLNRNFPTRDFTVGDPKHKYYGGEKAGTEPETKFILKLMEWEKPDLLVMLHTPYNFVNSDGDSLGLGPKLARELGMEYHEEMDYPTPGSIGTYFGKERGIPVITVEFPSRPDVWERFGEKMLKVLLESSEE